MASTMMKNVKGVMKNRYYIIKYSRNNVNDEYNEPIKAKDPIEASVVFCEQYPTWTIRGCYEVNLEEI